MSNASEVQSLSFWHHHHLHYCHHYYYYYIAVKTVNSICRKSLQRWLFNVPLEERTPDIILHTDVRWLRYKFLQRFCSLLSEINSFLRVRGDKKAELEDEKWLFDLAFLADFTG
jgi:hypothetical protein